MATERRGAGSMAEVGESRTQHQALVASLHTAIEALTACVESVYDLIEHVDAIAQAEDPHPQRRRARVSYGGGLSPLASLDHNGDPSRTLRPDAAAGMAESAGIGLTPPVARQSISPDPAPAPPGAVTHDANRGVDTGAGAPALMAATDLAHRGYSHDEIAARLRDRWGEEAGQILRDLME